MCGLQKSKRVSWASNLDLCQVRLFLSEESPSQVGLNSQDHLQAKTSLLLPPGGAGADDVLPPGFEGTHTSSQLDIKPSEIPVTRWINPQKIVLNLTWQVVAGEESREIVDQHQREMRVLEAFYPIISSIPPNPSVSVDVEDSHYVGGETVLIPITPVEDEDVAADTLPGSVKQFDVSSSVESSPGISKGSNSGASMPVTHGLMSDLAAASVALTSIVKSREHGNLSDQEIMNNILNNPELIEKLVRDYGVTNNPQYVHNVGSSPGAIPINQGETTTSSSFAFSTTSSYTHTAGGQVTSISTQWHPRPAVSSPVVTCPAEVPLAKGANYYKSLIQQHGGDKQETLPYSSSNRQIQQPLTNYEMTHDHRAKGSKPKIMKPCIFYNSSRGCRNGTNCNYQHDASSQPRGNAMSGIQSSKRMKMDNKISS